MGKGQVRDLTGWDGTGSSTIFLNMFWCSNIRVPTFGHLPIKLYYILSLFVFGKSNLCIVAHFISDLRELGHQRLIRKPGDNTTFRSMQ